MISLKSLKDIVNTNECRLLFPFMGRHLLNNQGKDVNKTLTDGKVIITLNKLILIISLF